MREEHEMDIFTTADRYICKLQAHLREEQYHEHPCLD